MKIYKRPILAFFYCETSRLVSITNDRQERKFKIHRSVENSKRWKSDPKKNAFPGKTFISDFPLNQVQGHQMPRIWKGFYFRVESTWKTPQTNDCFGPSPLQGRNQNKVCPIQGQIQCQADPTWKKPWNLRPQPIVKKFNSRWIGAIGVDR